MTLDAAGPPVRWGEASGRWVLAACILGSGMALLDATIVNVAVARIGIEFDADLAGLQWTLNAYTLTLAALILVSGSLSDRLGRRRVFVFGTTWFAVASALCALAPSVEVLVATRALQGVGGALLTPGSLAILSATFPPHERAKAIGAWSALGAVASAAGPFLGGWLVQLWSWRAIFLVNVPLAIVVVAIALRRVPESRDPGASGHVDVLGTVLGVAGLAGVTYAAIGWGEPGRGPATVLVGVAGLAALAALTVAERHTDNPLVPPGLFRSRRFSAANLYTFVVYAALGGVAFLLVLHLQVVAGFSPLLAGTALLPITVALLVLSTSAGAVAQRVGPAAPMAIGAVVAAAGTALLLQIGPQARYWVDVVPAMAVFGLGLAMLVAPLTAAVLAAAPQRHAGVASGVNNAVARTAGLLAVAALPTLSGLSGETYRDPTAFADGFRVSMLFCVALLVAGAVVAAVSMGSSGAAEDPPDAAAPPGRVG